MDNLKSLMDAKRYESVISLTEGSLDPTSIFYRITAFTALGNVNNALNEIEKNNKILQSNLPLLMKIHIEILCTVGLFDKAKDELERYEELPYFSQVAEEGFIALKKYIKEQEKAFYKTNKAFSEEEITRLLTSKKDEEVLLGIDSLRKLDINPYLNYFEKLLISYPRQSVRSFALMELVFKKTNKEVSFDSNGKIMKVNPSLLNEPFNSEKYINAVRKIRSESKDTSIVDNAINFLSTFVISRYPNELKEDEDVLVIASIKLASSYLKSNFDYEKVLELKRIKLENFLTFYEEFEDTVNKF